MESTKWSKTKNNEILTFDVDLLNISVKELCREIGRIKAILEITGVSEKYAKINKPKNITGSKVIPLFPQKK